MFQKVSATVASVGKTVGQVCNAKLTASHVGPASTVYISWGVAPGHSLAWSYADISEVKWLVSSKAVAVPEHSSPTSVTFNLTGAFPDIATSEENKYDCIIKILDANGQNLIKETDDWVWFDDIYYRLDKEEVVISFLNAVFT